MVDTFSGFSVGLTAPITAGFSITPNDATDLAIITRQIRITGSAGNLSVVWVDGSSSVETVAAGETLDWRIRRVLSTGTTATGIRGYA